MAFSSESFGTAPATAIDLQAAACDQRRPVPRHPPARVAACQHGSGASPAPDLHHEGGVQPSSSTACRTRDRRGGSTRSPGPRTAADAMTPADAGAQTIPGADPRGVLARSSGRLRTSGAAGGVGRGRAFAGARIRALTRPEQKRAQARLKRPSAAAETEKTDDARGFFRSSKTLHPFNCFDQLIKLSSQRLPCSRRTLTSYLFRVRA